MCGTRLLPQRPLGHGFSWKTAFYRGALLRISNRLYAQRKAQQRQQPAAPKPAAVEAAPAGAAVTALVVRTDQENADYIRQHFGAVRQCKTRRARYDTAAYRRGHERGGDVSLVPSRAPGSRPAHGRAS